MSATLIKRLLDEKGREIIHSLLAATPIIYCEIGARRGGERFHDLGTFIHYYGFEPDAEEAEKLRNRLRQANVFKEVSVFPHAIMGRAGTVSVNLLKHRGCSSVLFPDADRIAQYATRRGDTNRWSEYFEVVGRYECEATSLDEFVEKEKLRGIDFLELDTQGTEYEILVGGTNTISKSTLVVHVEMETVPLYTGQLLLADVMRLLYSLGFRLIKLENPVYVSRQPADVGDVTDQGELISVDGIFCRDLDTGFIEGIGSEPAAMVKYMLLLWGLDFRTMAISAGRRFQECWGRGDGCISALTATLEERYLADKVKAKLLRRKALDIVRKLVPVIVRKVRALLSRRKYFRLGGGHFYGTGGPPT